MRERAQVMRALPERERDQREQQQPPDRTRGQRVRALEGERVARSTIPSGASTPTTSSQPVSRIVPIRIPCPKSSQITGSSAQQQVAHQKIPPARISTSTQRDADPDRVEHGVDQRPRRRLGGPDPRRLRLREEAEEAHAPRSTTPRARAAWKAIQSGLAKAWRCSAAQAAGPLPSAQTTRSDREAAISR